MRAELPIVHTNKHNPRQQLETLTLNEKISKDTFTTCVQHVYAQCAWQQKQEVLSWSGSEAMLGRKTEAPHSLCGGEQVEDTGNNRCVFLLLTGGSKENGSSEKQATISKNCSFISS